MASALLLHCAMLLKKRKREEDLRSRFDIDNLPPLLVEALSNLVTTDFSYEEETRIYNEQQFALATNYIPAVPPGNLAHQDISCITSKESFLYIRRI